MILISKDKNVLDGETSVVCAEVSFAIKLLKDLLTEEYDEKMAKNLIKDICELGSTGRVSRLANEKPVEKSVKSKFHKGDKFVVEIAERQTHYTDDGKAYNLYRIKGFNSLVLDDYGIQKLIDIQEGEKE